MKKILISILSIALALSLLLLTVSCGKEENAVPNTQTVKYEYDYLDKIYSRISYWGMNYYGVTACAVDEKENKVAVYVAEEKREGLVEYLKTAFEDFDENCISFREPVFATT